MSKSFAEYTGDEMSVYKLLMSSVMNSIRVAMPGIIISFDSASQTACVKPAVNDVVQKDGKSVAQPLPAISDVPVAFPRGGDYLVSLPVKSGDACILVIGDHCIDGFMQGGTESTQAEIRNHDLSDAMAIVGISTGNSPIQNYHPDNLEIRHKEKDIRIALSGSSLRMCYEDSTIDMSTGSIKLSAGTVDVNGTIF